MATAAADEAVVSHVVAANLRMIRDTRLRDPWSHVHTRTRSAFLAAVLFLRFMVGVKITATQGNEKSEYKAGDARPPRPSVGWCVFNESTLKRGIG